MAKIAEFKAKEEELVEEREDICLNPLHEQLLVDWMEADEKKAPSTEVVNERLKKLEEMIKDNLARRVPEEDASEKKMKADADGGDGSENDGGEGRKEDAESKGKAQKDGGEGAGEKKEDEGGDGGPQGGGFKLRSQEKKRDVVKQKSRHRRRKKRRASRKII